jgi:segregation and condensation protein B
MVMRLVRDDEEQDALEPEVQRAMPIDQSAQEIDAAAPREPEAAGETDAAEQPDGAVDEAGEDEAGQSGDTISAELEVDLGAMEALLLSTHHPLTAGRLAELLDLESTKPIRRAVKRLNEQYASTSRSFRVEQVAGGFQLLTLPQFGEVLKKLHQREVDAKLTKAALETLSIIAYKQPILRAEIEAIRGVACGETVRSLMEKHLVKIAGRAEEPGRPILYGTTKRFLELFGLNSLRDLPQPEAAKNQG